jgi:hypothetical protein
MTIPTEPTAAATVNELVSMADRLRPLSDPFAVKAARDCWNCVSDLWLGCHCEEAAHTLVLSAEHWLERTAA